MQWHTDAYSEPEPVSVTLSDWGDDFHSGEHQWVSSQLTLGYRFQSGLEVAWLRRAQAATHINAEAAEFYGRIQREEPLSEGQNIPLSLTADSFSAQGVRVGYYHRWPSLSLRAGISYLKTRHLIDGTLQGQFVALADNEYQMEAEIDYVYYTDPVFNRPDIIPATGQGISTDLALEWQINKQWALALAGKDLLAAIDWKRAPHSTGEANTRRKAMDEEGYTRFNPLFTGREGYKDSHTQRIAPSLNAQVRRAWGQWGLSAHWRRQFDVNHWGVGAGFSAHSGQRISLIAWPQRNAIELEWRTRHWQAALHTDLQGWSSTHRLGLTLTYTP